MDNATSPVHSLAPHLLRTTMWDGTARHWGVCGHCGHIEELTAAQAPDWQRTGTCETCTEDLAQEERELRWYRAE